MEDEENQERRAACRPGAVFFSADFDLAVAADDEVVAVGTVKAEHVEDNDALGGVNDLADAQQGFALGNSEEFGGAGIGDGGVDFFVGVAEFDVVFALESGEERSVLERRGEQAGELGGREIAGFECEGFAGGAAKTLELEDAALGRKRQARSGFFFVVDNFCEENFRDGREAAAAHLFGVGHQFVEVNFWSGDESADAAAALDDAFAFERSEGVARGHQADFVEAGEFPFGCDRVTRPELAGFDDTANRTLNAAIRGNSIVAFGEHFRSSTQQPGHTPRLNSARLKTKQR